MNLNKGDPVIYRPRYLDFDVSAIVRKCHRDGTVTVEARFALNDDGTPDVKAGYLGYEYRMKPEQLRRDH